MESARDFRNLSGLPPRIDFRGQAHFGAPAKETGLKTQNRRLSGAFVFFFGVRF